MEFGNSVRRLYRAELCRAVAGEVGRIGVIGAERIFLDPGQALALPVGEKRLWRLIMRGARDEQRPARLVHAGTMGEARLGQPLDLARIVEAEGIIVLFARIGLVRAGQEHPAFLLLTATAPGERQRVL